MITRPTTLLLGAGASAHLGFPLGLGLREMILEYMNSCQTRVRDVVKIPEPIWEFGSSAAGRRFTEIFTKGQYLSIDELLADHHEFERVGKQLIAFCLQQFEREHELYNGKRANWYQVLGAALVAENQDEFRNNKLGIVTFNYDRSIDRFLHNLVMYRYKLDSKSAWNLILETIPIVHLHGQLGPYPQFPYTSGDHWTSAANYIKVVHEMKEGYTLSEFQKANEMLMKAESVHIIGFSMGERNVANLPFFIQQRSSGGIYCAIGEKITNREYADLRHRLRDCGFLTDSNLLRLNSDKFYDQFGFAR